MPKLCNAVLVVVLGAALAGLLGGDALTVGLSRAAWTEVKWPFPLDQWGIGKAYRCSAADCGGEISVYLRAKIGFCNCATGVADDPELDRVGDLEILSEKWVGLADGREIKVGWMKGRSRPYLVEMRYASPVTALAMGFNDKCDVAVATVVADRNRLGLAERLTLDFLNTDRVLRWAERELGI
jgi:hypothetical protein